jgi:hypothetical protein
MAHRTYRIGIDADSISIGQAYNKILDADGKMVTLSTDDWFEKNVWRKARPICGFTVSAQR